ncbi:hypothetical protein APHAL10511_000744 [Amanita phalloides]|nr:hypothetical protein APHAL10511_000744 [Amanita phalloides]
MLQYYELVRARRDSVLSGLLQKHQRFGAWDDRAGYAGYVPSGRYFGGIYNLVMEEHAREIDQHMAMLSCHILTIDHSFKVPKHLGKVNSEAIFGALHTGINKYVEIHTMTLTPTKGHSQFMPALATIPHSLRDYGHEDIELVFTDNVCTDKIELERVFPSLSQGVMPIPVSSMECLKVPVEWSTTILKSAYQILTQLNIILQELETLPAEQFIDIAMDMECNETLTQRNPLPPHPDYDPYASSNFPAQAGTDESHADSLDLDWSTSIPYDAETEQSLDGSVMVTTAAAQAEALPASSLSDGSPQMAPALYKDTDIRSQVLGDIWHLMNQFKIPLSHGLHCPFARALRDALFVPDPVDKAAVESVLQKKNVTWEQMVLWKPEWVWK